MLLKALHYIIEYHKPNNTCHSSSSSSEAAAVASAAGYKPLEASSILMDFGLPIQSLVDLHYTCD
jgi:hypothetical protein